MKATGKRRETAQIALEGAVSEVWVGGAPTSSRVRRATAGTRGVARLASTIMRCATPQSVGLASSSARRKRKRKAKAMPQSRIVFRLRILTPFGVAIGKSALPSTTVIVSQTCQVQKVPGAVIPTAFSPTATFRSPPSWWATHSPVDKQVMALRLQVRSPASKPTAVGGCDTMGHFGE